MILTDTGPVVALLDKDDAYHTVCVTAVKQLSYGPMLTTWPCFTEAMYLLGSVGGYQYQTELWRLRTNGRLILHDHTYAEIDRMDKLMAQYQDTPMDLADASLVVVAESRKFHHIFSLDNDFRIYRLRDGTTLEVVP
ncbi:MAG: PIN domain-containing protein [Candidatus Omnitrophota bacterium]|jgi:predicted nucleic acid-binding protein|nr:MAG: PIN domain-containing protein [Candidatus Omnitrophota bacterium]